MRGWTWLFFAGDVSDRSPVPICIESVFDGTDYDPWILSAEQSPVKDFEPYPGPVEVLDGFVFFPFAVLGEKPTKLHRIIWAMNGPGSAGVPFFIHERPR